MNKPKELSESWQVDGDGDVRRVNGRGERTSLVFLRAATGTPAAQVLASAAPDMARALLALVAAAKSESVYSLLPGEIALAEVALVKAGVPL